MTDGPARYALYYAPEPDDPLHAAGSAWLGRDAETGAACAQPDLPGIAALTEAPRGYGFHATLRPPFRLRPGLTFETLLLMADAIAARLPAIDLPAFAVADLDGFLALRETAPSPGLHAIADACVVATNPCRAEPDAAELARRHAAGLSARESELLGLWGYPHVLACWRFHITLSRRLTPQEHARLRPAAEAHFAASLAQPRRLTHLALFTQRAPGAPFLIAERLPLADA